MKKPRAAIVLPSISDFYATPHRISGLGARIVENILRSNGWDTRLILFPRGKKRRIPLSEDFAYLKEHLIPGEFGPTSFFSQRHRFGPSPEEEAVTILAEEPDAVFLSVFAFAYADDALALAGVLKERRPSLLIYGGGAGATVLPDYLLKEGTFDAVIPGEAEESLIEHLRDGPGLHAGQSERTSSGRMSFALACIKETQGGAFYATTLSRGCPKRCAFCSNHLIQGRQFRTVPAEEVFSEMGKLPKNLPLHINFEDDNLLLDREYFFDLLEGIKGRFPQARFSAENGLDYLLLDKETIDRLMALGFTQFNLSMASQSESILKEENRQGDLNHLKSLLAHIARQGIPSITYFIAGLRLDSLDSVLENLLFLAEQPTLTGISLFYPVPGLPGFKDKKLFFKQSSYFCAGSSAFPWTGSLSTSQLITAFRLARLSNFLKKTGYGSGEKELLTKIRRERRLYSWARTDGEKKTLRPPCLDQAMERLFFKHFAKSCLATG